jgi:hypothetical protein
MNLRKMMLVCAVALGGLAVGCGNKCKSTCEDGKKCADAEPSKKTADCDKLCDDLDDLSDTANCSDQYDKLMDCADDHDACDDNACAAEGSAWGACVGAYCVAHTTDAKCTAAGTDDGS